VEHIATMPNLEVLVLPSKVTDAGLPKLKALTKLRSLSLSFGCSDKGLGCLKDVGKLQTLSLFGMHYTDRGLESLKGIELSELRLYATNVIGTALALFPHLRKLELTSGWKPLDPKALASLEQLKELRELNLSRNKIGDDALDHIKQLPNLERLSLADTKITDAGLEKLKGLKKLQYFSCGRTAVTNDGIQAFARGFPRLTWSK
jgi:internalin A